MQKKTIRELKLKEKYQSTKDDPSPIFYQIMAERNKKDRLIETCDIMNSDGTIKETLSHPADIAAHISSTYAKLFNNESHTSMEALENFLGQDRDRLGKISEYIKEELENELTMTEMR